MKKLTEIMGLVIIGFGIVGCNNTSDKILGNWSTNNPTESGIMANKCTFKFTFKKQSDNIIVENSTFSVLGNVMDGVTMIQNKDNPNVFTSATSIGTNGFSLSLTYYKDDDTLKFPAIPMLCPAETLHRVQM